MSLQPARGEWRNRLLTSNSTATFVQGSLVAFNPRRLVVEYTSVSSAAIGIALHDSVNSLAAPGKVLVAVPSGLECTMWVPTGTTAVSALSYGQACGIAKSGNTVDQIDTVVTSVGSVIGSVYGTICDTSTVSRIEVAVNVNNWVWYSASSNTFKS